MKIFLSLLFVFTLTQAYADTDLRCEVRHNYELVLVNEFSLPQNAKNLSFGSFNEFEFLLTSVEGKRAELQIYDAQTPSRTYSVGELRKEALELILWTREQILDVRCLPL